MVIGCILALFGSAFLVKTTKRLPRAELLGYAWIASPVFVAVLWVISRIGYRDPKWVASQVESRFPI